MSVSDIRGVVEKVDDNFTHVRTQVAAGLFLFNHQGMNAAPDELRKEGTEVIIFEDREAMLLRIRLAPKKVMLRARGSPAPGGVPAAPQHVKLPARRQG